MRRLARRSLALLAMLSVVACNGGGDGTDPTAVPRVRVINAIGNAPALDIVVDGTVVTPTASPFTYGTNTGYLIALAGTRSIAVRLTTATDAIASATPELAPNADYTIIAAGRMGATSGPVPRLIVVADTARPATGMASIHVVHAGAPVGSVDVYLPAPGDDIASRAPAFTNLAFGDATPPLAVSVGQGTVRIRLTNAGTKVVVDDITTTVADGKAYLALLTGDDAASIVVYTENEPAREVTTGTN